MTIEKLPEITVVKAKKPNNHKTLSVFGCDLIRKVASDLNLEYTEVHDLVACVGWNIKERLIAGIPSGLPYVGTFYTLEKWMIRTISQKWIDSLTWMPSRVNLKPSRTRHKILWPKIKFTHRVRQELWERGQNPQNMEALHDKLVGKKRQKSTRRGSNCPRGPWINWK